MRIAKLIASGVLGGGRVVPWYEVVPGAAVAYCALGAADAAASYVNLITPGTKDLVTGVVPPAFDPLTGWSWDGATQHCLETGFLATSQNCTYMVRFSDCVDATYKAALAYSTTNASVSIQPQSTNNNVGYVNGAGGLNISPKLLSGILGIAGNKGYRNGVVEPGEVGAWGATNSKKLNIAGGGTGFLGSQIKVQAVIVYESVLDPTQMLALAQAMAAIP